MKNKWENSNSKISFEVVAFTSFCFFLTLSFPPSQSSSEAEAQDIKKGEKKVFSFDFYSSRLLTPHNCVHETLDGQISFRSIKKQIWETLELRWRGEARLSWCELDGTLWSMQIKSICCGIHKTTQFNSRLMMLCVQFLPPLLSGLILRDTEYASSRWSVS